MSEQSAERVAVRVTDLYEIVRAFYASDDRHSSRQQTAADRLHIAMLGVPRIDQIMRQYDGSECAT